MAFLKRGACGANNNNNREVVHSVTTDELGPGEAVARCLGGLRLVWERGGGLHLLSRFF